MFFSEDIGYFYFNCSEQLLNDTLFFNYCYCEYLTCLEVPNREWRPRQKRFLA